MTRRGPAAAAVLLAVLVGDAARARACAVCSCGDPTLTATGVEKPYRNRVRVAIEERFGSFTIGEGEATERALYLHSLVAASFSPHERVTLAALVPWVTTWLTPPGSARQTISGLGDLELSLRAVAFRERRFVPRHLLWASGGIKTPTGYRVRDDQGYPYPEDDQPGSGSWDPFAGLTYGWFGDRLGAFASTSYRLTTQNPRGYRRGASLGASAAFQVRVFSWAAAAIGADVAWTQADRQPGGADALDSGGTAVHLAPTVLLTPLSDLLVKISASVPVIHAMNGHQDMGTQFVVALAWDAH